LINHGAQLFEFSLVFTAEYLVEYISYHIFRYFLLVTDRKAGKAIYAGGIADNERGNNGISPARMGVLDRFRMA
jgi:hypothetical protein